MARFDRHRHHQHPANRTDRWADVWLTWDVVAWTGIVLSVLWGGVLTLLMLQVGPIEYWPAYIATMVCGVLWPSLFASVWLHRQRRPRSRAAANVSVHASTTEADSG